MALAPAAGMSSIFRPRIAFLALLAGCAADLGGPEDHDDIGELSSEINVCGSSIQSVIDEAPAGSVLVMCPGTYNERLTIRGKSLTLRGRDGAETTIIDAGASGPVLAVSNTPAPGVTVRGLTLRNGSAAGAGGGIRCNASRLIVGASVIADNAAEGGGGLSARGCALTVTATLFQNNDGNSRNGGGAWVVDSSGSIATSRFLGNRAERGGGVAVIEGTLVLRDSEIRNNVASVRGGGLYHSSNASVLRTTIADNSSDWIGGGVYVYRHAPTISASTIRNNTSVNDGGGFYIHQSGAQLLDNTIAGNVAQDDGGGVRVFESESRLEGNLIEDNLAGDGGGGIRLSHLQSTLIDNVVRNNSSGNIAGGIELDNDSSIVRGGVVEGNTSVSGGGIAITLAPFNGCRVDRVEIRDNDASVGGGIYMADNYAPVSLRRLTVEGNQASRGAGLDVRATDFTLDHSVFDGNVAEDQGGAIAHRPPGACPEAPCPPADPVGEIDFIVAYNNGAASGAFLWSNQEGLSIENSIIQGNDGTGVDLDDEIAAPTWRYNLMRPRSFDGMADPTGTQGNIAANPLFVAPIAGDFRLQAGSPARDAADPALSDADGSRADMGRFGGL